MQQKQDVSLVWTRWTCLFFLLLLCDHPVCGWMSASSSPLDSSIQTSPTRVQSSSNNNNNMADDTTTTTTTTKTVVVAAPQLPLPPPICSNIPNTWAHDTMSRRINDEILQRTVADMQDHLQTPAFAPIKQRIEELRSHLAASSKLYYPQRPTQPERQTEWDQWHQILHPYIEKQNTWLTAPWMVSEFLVYRLLMDALDYWNPESAGYLYDPFTKAKTDGLISSVISAQAILQKDGVPNLRVALSLALWGNQMDLSLWPADTTNKNNTIDPFAKILATAQDHLLCDDTLQLEEYFSSIKKPKQGGCNIHIVVDNAGFELVTDLMLGTYFLESGLAQTVTFQTKSHPTFVSDALNKDVMETIHYYSKSLDGTHYPHCVAAGRQWQSYLDNHQFVLNQDDFWVQPWPMWQMTEPLRTQLRNDCDLCVVKGDANYRRLLGDCAWQWNDPFEGIVGCSFPVPMCALRTLKAEIGCGMSTELTRRAADKDQHWMTNGRYGVVQFGRGASR